MGKSLGVNGTGDWLLGEGKGFRMQDLEDVSPRGLKAGEWEWRVTVGILDRKLSGRGMWDLGWVWWRWVCGVEDAQSTLDR